MASECTLKLEFVSYEGEVQAKRTKEVEGAEPKEEEVQAGCLAGWLRDHHFLWGTSEFLLGLGALQAGLEGQSAPVMVRPLITGFGDHSVPCTFPLGSEGGADRSGMLPSGPGSVLRRVKPADLGLGWASHPRVRV